MSYRTLLSGRAYRFLYPSINFKFLISCMEERRILVERIRDTFTEPLDDETLNSNRFVKRGRWLVTGMDLDNMEERSFYVESMVAVMEIGLSLLRCNTAKSGVPRVQFDNRICRSPLRKSMTSKKV